jgi:hypothetical protein
MLQYRYRAIEKDMFEPPERIPGVETQKRHTWDLPFWWTTVDFCSWKGNMRMTWDEAIDTAYEWGEKELHRRTALKVKKRRTGSWWP